MRRTTGTAPEPPHHCLPTRTRTGDSARCCDLHVSWGPKWAPCQGQACAERARALDTVIFDKTGTLTRGSPAVSEVAAAPATSEDKLVAYSAAVESNSEHPLAKAILAEAGRRNLTQSPATNFEALSGRGARALVKGKSIAVGAPRLLTEANVTVPPAVEKLTTAWASDGKTVLYAVADDRLLGAFAVEDEIRPE